MTTRNAFQTASPARLVLALYDGAIGSVERASEALAVAEEPRRTETVHRELVRAQNILTELRIALDHEAGGVIAANLDSLYSWCLARLPDANVAKDPAGLPPVQKVLGDLREAWSTACC
jgi:flagellar protein FliS